MRLCVFCGSSSGNDPFYAEACGAFVRACATAGLSLVYGGGKVGLMGALAEAALDGGVDITGVVPQPLFEAEIAHRGLSRLHVVANMHERKALMADLSDAFVALPGGVGTLEELFEQWTWGQIGLHSKPCGLLNSAGYYDPMLAMIERMTASGFLAPAYREMLVVEADPAAFLRRIREAGAVAPKWRDRVAMSAQPRPAR